MDSASLEKDECLLVRSQVGEIYENLIWDLLVVKNLPSVIVCSGCYNKNTMK